jgi:predicted Rossmann-fold nucleotide-binding protein
MRRELDSTDGLRAFLEAGTPLEEAVLQGIDLAPFEEALAMRDLKGALFAGCRLSPAFLLRALERGALVFPRVDGRPFDAWRTHLYTPDELYRGFDPARPQSYLDTPDYRVYDSFVDPATRRVRPAGLDEVLAHRLHDLSVSDALADFLETAGSHGVVAVMGGHDSRRDERPYREIAGLARTLTREGFLLISGGGPGLMEATNLGAYLADRDEAVLEDAVSVLSTAPSYRDAGWLAAAFRVRERHPPGPDHFRSLGVPTWFYGHEPANPFATHIAKYFENSVREEGLLAIATHGVVFAPGNAGTVQEVFQDACQNYYRTYTHYASPMVLFGTDYWNASPSEVRNAADRRKPLLPLLRQLARERDFEHSLLCTDSVEEIVSFLRAFRT